MEFKTLFRFFLFYLRVESMQLLIVSMVIFIHILKEDLITN